MVKQTLQKQHGFTLVELMIAVVLGLLVIAAGLAIFLSGQRSLSFQNGMSELQQQGIFGLGLVSHDVRHANLDTNTDGVINPTANGSGIVFSADNVKDSVGFAANFFTQQEVTTTNMDVNSDQLTIQFKPTFKVTYNATGQASNTTNFSNCQGGQFSFNHAGRTTKYTPINVQRYFVQEMRTASNASYSPRRYGLYCDSAYYYPEGERATDKNLIDMNQNAQLIMADVEAFKVKLAVKSTTNGNIRYMTINEYKASPSVGNVVGVNLGILARSANPVGGDAIIDNSKVYNLFGDGSYGQVKLADTSGAKYLRQEMSQVVALRNTVGVEQ